MNFFWQFQDKKRKVIAGLIGTLWVFLLLLKYCTFIPRLSKDVLIVLMDGWMLVDNYNWKSLTTFGMKVIWRSLSSRWLLSLAFISEVRRLIQVSVCIIFALVSLFGIMSWLPRSFWAVNHRDVQEERENFRRGYSDTLEMYALFQAQHSVVVSRAVRVRTPTWACNQLWRYASVWEMNQGGFFCF